MRKFLFIGLCALLMVGCKTAETVVTVPRNDSIVVHHHYEHDSIYVQDSMAMALVHDTVFIHKWHTDIRYRTLQRIDTIWQDKEVVITKPPERYVPSFYKWCAGILITLIIAIVGYTVLRIVLKIYLRR